VLRRCPHFAIVPDVGEGNRANQAWVGGIGVIIVSDDAGELQGEPVEGVLDTRRCVLLDQLGIGGVGNIRDADRARAF
jgi:hypothetical protein